MMTDDDGDGGVLSTDHAPGTLWRVGVCTASEHQVFIQQQDAYEIVTIFLSSTSPHHRYQSLFTVAYRPTFTAHHRHTKLPSLYY